MTCESFREFVVGQLYIDFVDMRIGTRFIHDAVKDWEREDLCVIVNPEENHEVIKLTDKGKQIFLMSKL